MNFISPSIRETMKKNENATKIYHLYKKIIVMPIYKLNLKLNMLLGKPYFGRALYANQCWKERYPVMEKLIKEEIKDNFNLLEIGSWAGHSTVLWGSVVKGRGKVFCIDTWGGAGNTPQLRNKDKEILDLFNHNIKTSGLNNTVIPIRGTSDALANVLQNNYFDFVYVDGDHSYSQFKKDLLNYTKKVKLGGIIAGDDLELYPNEVDIDNAIKHCEEDFILDTKTKKYFHPGICTATHEIFKDNISMKNGFWAMRKTRTGWKKIKL